MFAKVVGWGGHSPAPHCRSPTQLQCSVEVGRGGETQKNKSDGFQGQLAIGRSVGLGLLSRFAMECKSSPRYGVRSTPYAAALCGREHLRLPAGKMRWPWGVSAEEAESPPSFNRLKDRTRASRGRPMVCTSDMPPGAHYEKAGFLTGVAAPGTWPWRWPADTRADKERQAMQALRLSGKATMPEQVERAICRATPSRRRMSFFPAEGCVMRRSSDPRRRFHFQ